MPQNIVRNLAEKFDRGARERAQLKLFRAAAYDSESSSEEIASRDHKIQPLVANQPPDRKIAIAGGRYKTRA